MKKYRYPGGDIEFYVRDSETSDTLVVHEIWRDNTYQTLVPPSLFDPQCVVDLGGNIGIYTIQMAKFFPTARVIMVEPDAGNLAVAQANFELHDVHPEIRTEAISDRRGTAEWFSDSGRSAITALPMAHVVRTITLDDLLADVPRVDLLKIDIEGGEVRALQGASPESLCRINRIVGEFHGLDYRWGEWVRYLSAFFDVTFRAHPYPNHVSGGYFWGERIAEGAPR